MQEVTRLAFEARAPQEETAGGVLAGVDPLPGRIPTCRGSLAENHRVLEAAVVAIATAAH